MTEVAAPKIVPSAVQVLGVGDLVTNLAQCCHPVPGDRIIGYITRSRGVTIHRQDCYNVLHEDEKDRLVPVEWGKTDARYPVRIQVEAWDRVGLMRDLTTIVAEEKINIAALVSTHHEDRTVTEDFTLGIQGLAQLSRLLKKIEAVRGVTSITRIGDEATTKTGTK